jgi:glycerol-3-phosphate dehydrogenase
MVGLNDFVIKPRKGEEYLLDKSYYNVTQRVIFPVPTPVSKGTLIIPTVDKTVMVGPSAEEIDNRFDLSTSSVGLEKIFSMAKALTDHIDARGVIASFSGIRAVSNTNDFIIGPTSVPNFINCAGIQSPGLTAAPAIAEYVLEILKKETKLEFSEKNNWQPTLSNPLKIFSRMTPEEQEEIVEKDKRYANVVCRCELVTVGDVHAAIDQGGIKFRTRATGMGKCQGGFCSARKFYQKEISTSTVGLEKIFSMEKALTDHMQEVLSLHFQCFEYK